MVDEPTDLDTATLDSVPVIQGPNGLKVKIHPNGKTVSDYSSTLDQVVIGSALVLYTTKKVSAGIGERLTKYS